MYGVCWGRQTAAGDGHGLRGGRGSSALARAEPDHPQRSEGDCIVDNRPRTYGRRRRYRRLLLTPELQWQSGGQTACLTGGGVL